MIFTKYVNFSVILQILKKFENQLPRKNRNKMNYSQSFEIFSMKPNCK